MRNINLQTANMVPSDDGVYDIGATYARYRNVYASNTVSSNSLVVAGTATAKNVVVSDTVTSNSLVVAAPSVPINPTSAGTPGAIAWSNSYIYVCVATNTWVRSAISTWDPNVTVSATTAAIGESFHPYLLSLL